MSIDLSFVIATRNRLPFLKITLGEMIGNLQPGEELIVIDGNSTDGSKEYLQQFFSAGKIHQFISEPDHNQAHAWNKGMLMANGTIIKKIIDDDVYDLDAIRKCKDFMLQHPQIDVCISNSLESNLANPAVINTESRLPWYKNWKTGIIKTFSFGDVHMLIRRSSLSFIGLYDTQFKMIDWEYSLRISFLQAKIAYYTGCNAMSVATPGNVSSTATKKLFKYEAAIGEFKYNYPGDQSEISLFSHIKIAIGKFIARLKPNTKEEIDYAAGILPAEEELRKQYSIFYKTLKEYNISGDREFLK